MSGLERLTGLAEVIVVEQAGRGLGEERDVDALEPEVSDTPRTEPSSPARTKARSRTRTMPSSTSWRKMFSAAEPSGLLSGGNSTTR